MLVVRMHSVLCRRTFETLKPLHCMSLLLLIRITFLVIFHTTKCQSSLWLYAFIFLNDLMKAEIASFIWLLAWQAALRIEQSHPGSKCSLCGWQACACWFTFYSTRYSWKEMRVFYIPFFFVNHFVAFFVKSDGAKIFFQWTILRMLNKVGLIWNAWRF